MNILLSNDIAPSTLIKISVQDVKERLSKTITTLGNVLILFDKLKASGTAKDKCILQYYIQQFKATFIRYKG